nr:MAG TPA: hypothetical protein [Bacteriophage sp.]
MSMSFQIAETSLFTIGSSITLTGFIRLFLTLIKRRL